VLPGLSRPSAGRINLEVLFPGIYRQVPCLGFLISNSQVKEGTGLIVFTQVWFAKDLAQHFERALQIGMLGPAVALKVAGSQVDLQAGTCQSG
jgi:hypothetical protein